MLREVLAEHVAAHAQDLAQLDVGRAERLEKLGDRPAQDARRRLSAPAGSGHREPQRRPARRDAEEAAEDRGPAERGARAHASAHGAYARETSSPRTRARSTATKQITAAQSSSVSSFITGPPPA